MSVTKTLAVGVVFLGLVACARVGGGDSPRSHGKTAEHRYQFSADWFSPHIPVWEEHIAHFKGKPRIRYLEVGVYEGRSFFWVLDNILTGPGSTATAVDVFLPPWESVFRSNLRASGAQNRVTVYKGDSQDVLKTLKGRMFDMAYIDASHAARDVLFDALLAWDLLKPGGIMIFDDYEKGTPSDREFGRDIPDELRPRPAIDAFVTVQRRELRVLHRGYQLLIERTGDQCQQHKYDDAEHFHPNLCTAVGHLVYNWNTGRFFGKDAPKLTGKERMVLEKYLTSPRFGQADPPPEALDSPRLTALLDRLQVTVPEKEPAE